MIGKLNKTAYKIANKHSKLTQSIRWINIYEHQAKKIMEKYKVRVQKGDVANSPDSAHEIAKSLLKKSFSKTVILKAQVLAGGRGKGHYEDGFKGGIHVLRDEKEVPRIAEKMLKKKLITKQTGADGEMVSDLLVLDGLDFEKECYFAILLDRQHKGPVIVGSPMGGMDIEEVARTHSDQLKKIPIDYLEGVTDEQAREMSKFLGVDAAIVDDAVGQIKALYDLFIGEQATQVEINPLVVAKDDAGKDRVFCVDAKLNVDENSPSASLEKFDDPRMKLAADNNLSFIPLDGTIGCMVNGAGLAMATMDIIKLKGGSPANFLDVGGGANEKQVKAAFELIASDPKVRGILVNIFGGIMRCDIIANGIVNAAKSLQLSVPVVVRLEGTMSDEGKRILFNSGLAINTANSLDEAAEKAVLHSSRSSA